MLLRAALVCALTLAAGAVQALCAGPSLLDRLSQEERGALEARLQDTPFHEGLLWQATRGDDVLTIVGTMHIHDPRLLSIRDRLIPLVAESELVLLEMTPNEEAQMQAAMAADPSLMFLTDGPTLPDLLDDATWKAVADAARDRNIPPFMAAKFQPWFLMLTLAMPGCAMEHMVEGKLGLDHMLMTEADIARVPMQALEDWDTLFRIFDEGSIEEQLDYLRLSLIAPDLAEEMFVAMLDGYFAGEVAQVWELSRLSMQFMPGIDPAEADALFDLTEEQLLTRRNMAWIPVIEAAADRHDRIMIAAGAAHLPGQVGVLNLLQDNGWTITPLN
jgi:uncharacterized protein